MRCGLGEEYCLQDGVSGRKTWALVTDGVRARVLRGLERGQSDAPHELISKSPSTHLLDVLSDRSGQKGTPGPGHRGAAIQAGREAIRRDMQDFARDIGDLLERHRRVGDFDRLAIFAAPDMLGILHQDITADLRATVILERAVNLIVLPALELREVVLDALRG